MTEATASVSDLVLDIRKILEDEPWEAALTGPVAIDATVIPVDDGTRWEVDDVGEFDDDSGDRFKVISVAVNNLTVKRRHDGSIATSHLSGTRVLLNPRWARDQIVQAVNQTVNSLWPWAWKRKATNVTAHATNQVMPITAEDFIDLIAVTQKTAAGESVVYGRKGTGLPVVVERGHKTLAATEGGATLRFPNGFKTTAGGFTTVDILYRAPVTINDLGIASGLADCVVWGACWRLMAYKDVARTGEDVLMNNTGVQPGLMTQMSTSFRTNFEGKRKEVFAYLMKNSPPVIGQPGMTDIEDYYSYDMTGALLNPGDQGAPTPNAQT